MSSSWRSPFLPSQQNPKPVTTSKRAALRPPIHNPYDKFTQPEFDAWIGDITGALRKALKMEPEEEETASVGDDKRDAFARAEAEEERTPDEGDRIPQVDQEQVLRGEGLDEDHESEAFEDSFAHIKSRKAKGKARDPREGPGLGNVSYPVELGSDSEVEEQGSGSEEEWQQELRDNHDEEEEVEQEYPYDDDEVEDEDEDDEWGGFQTLGGQSSDQPIELLSDDEDEDEKLELHVHVKYGESEVGEDEDEDVAGYDVEDVAQPELLDEDDAESGHLAVFPEDEEEPLEDSAPPVELPDLWEGPNTFAEDYYAGGDLVAPAAAGLTPDNLTPADMSPLVDADVEYQDFTTAPDDMLPSPSPEPEVFEVDDDEPAEIESLPGSSPPPAEADDEVDELYADLDETITSPPASGLPTTVITQSDEIELTAFEADYHPRQQQNEKPEWEWTAPSTNPGHSHVDDQYLMGDTLDYGDAYDNTEGDEDVEQGSFGALPLGTSDLDIPDTWGMDADEGEEAGSQQEYEVSEATSEHFVRAQSHEEVVEIEEMQSIEGQDVLLGEVESVADVERSKSVALSDVADFDGIAVFALGHLANAQAGPAVSPLASAVIDFQDEDSFGELPATPSPDVDIEEPANSSTEPHPEQSSEFLSGFVDAAEQIPSLDTAGVLETIEALGKAEEESLHAKYKAWVSEELEGKPDVDDDVLENGVDATLPPQDGVPETANDFQPPVREPETLDIGEGAQPVEQFSLPVEESGQSIEESSKPVEELANPVDEDQVDYVVEEEEEVVIMGDELSTIVDDGFSDVGSVKAGELGDAVPAILTYIIEDALTEGRRTEEPEDPAMLLSVDAPSKVEEKPDFQASNRLTEDVHDSELHEDVPNAVEVEVDIPSEAQPADVDNANTTDRIPTAEEDVAIDTSSKDLPDAAVPAPVSADPTVPDPTSRPHSPQHDEREEPPQISASSLPKPSAIPSHVVEAVMHFDDVDDDDSSIGQSKSVMESGLFTPVGTGIEDGTPAPSESSVKAHEAPVNPVREGSAPYTPSADEAQEQRAPEIVVDETATSYSRDATPVPASDQDAVPPVGLEPVKLDDAGHQEPVAPQEPKQTPPELAVDVNVPTQPVEGSLDEDKDNIAEAAPLRSEATPEDEEIAELTYPTDSIASSVNSPTARASSPHQNVTVEGGDIDADAETDADGEADPDYVHEDENTTNFAEADPSKLMGSNSTVAPGPIKDDQLSPSPTPSTQENNKEVEDNGDAVNVESSLEPLKNSEPSVEVPPQAEEPVHAEESLEPQMAEQSTESKATPDTEGDAVIAEPPDAHDQASTSATTPADSESSQTQKSLKRKRRSPGPALPPRVTRSKASQAEAGRKIRSQAKKNTNGKGKQKQKSASKAATEATGDDSTDIALSRSASVAENRMLPTPSGSVSRAQSVASTESVESQSAPSTSMEPPPPVDLRPMFHSHSQSFIHHHHHRPAVPPAALPPPITQSQPSVPSRASSSAAEVQLLPASLQRTPRKHRAPSMSSPVTRSNCKFHKISLPREEGGPRVSFIVPGCSLGDGELMSSQEIVDHGFATLDDHGRMIPDIESLDFNSYLIGVLRQLVGVDLLREHEVFYLPNPGEQVSEKQRNKAAVEKAKRPRQSISAVDYAALHDPSFPRSPVASQSRSRRRSVTPSVHSRATGSHTDSASVAGSSARLQDASRPGTASILSGAESDLSDVDDLAEEAPKAKRLKTSPINEADNVSVSSASVSVAASQSKPAKLRRSTRRPLNPDAAAYKPAPDDAAEESADDAKAKDSRSRRRKSGVKSNKRRLTEDIPSTSAPVAKRSRIRKSVSAADAPKVRS